MDHDSHFDPIQASENLKSGFIDYITTTFPITDGVYRKALRKALNEPGFLTKGPYLDLSGSYLTNHSLNALIDAGKVSRCFRDLEPVEEAKRKLMLDRPLYWHQEEALLKADAGHNLIVTTGTGSGKTECFLIPIFQQLLKEKEKGTLSPGVRAILIYPMNALANDQMKRMRKILKNFDSITFGLYNGNTKYKEKEAEKAFADSFGEKEKRLKNEMISREEMQKNPPHILITNYSMLEHMMLRPKDDLIFAGAKLRYIVLDEAHVYKGTTGMETAMLIRRLRARIEMGLTRTAAHRVQFILTSATLGGKDADEAITRFGQRLCGVDFEAANIIRAKDATPAMKKHRAYPAELFHKLADSANSVSAVLSELGIADPAPDGDDGEKLYELLLTSSLFSKLRGESARPKDLMTLSRDLDISRDLLLDLIAVCARAEKNKTALLKARIHYFVRALEGAYITLGADPRLMLTRKVQDENGKAVFEAAICRNCGRLALVGREDRNTEQLVQVARSTDKDPKECDFFLLWDEDEEAIVFDDDDDDDDEADATGNANRSGGTDESDFAVCSCCGKLSSWTNQGMKPYCKCEKPDYHHIRRVRRTKSQAARCPACGTGKFRAFYLGTEAATSVLGTELFEQLPIKQVKREKEDSDKKPEPEEENPFEMDFDEWDSDEPADTVEYEEKTPQFLCFSDSRSEAAHFAVFMEKSYEEYLRNRGIWKLAEERESMGRFACSADIFAEDLAEVYENEKSFAHWDPDGEMSDETIRKECRHQARVALVSELYKARNTISLSSMGLLHFRYDSNAYRSNKAGIAKVLKKHGNLSEAEADALVQQLIQDGVENGALTAGNSLKPSDLEAIFHSETRRVLVRQREKGEQTYKNGWLPSSRTNGGYYPNNRVRRVMQALGCEAKTAVQFLDFLWKKLEFAEEFAFDLKDFQLCLNSAPYVRTWRCRCCGNVTVHQVKGRCVKIGCKGTLEEVSPEQLQEGNHYTKRYHGDRMKPLQMREHTAQLARDCQTRYQQAFVDGDLNALSCSTTFEMGVDVGGLETVYMRDIPPGPANYVQRAGRAGRAAHTAAYVLTYAKLSSHDFTFYKEPEKVISGKIEAPVFEIENEKVLYRHIFAVALAHFFALHDDVYCHNNRCELLRETDESKEDAKTGGYERLVEYLKPPLDKQLSELLKRSVPQQMHDRLGITDDSWTEKLVGEKGVLKLAVEEYRGELKYLKNEMNAAARKGEHDKIESLSRMIRNLESRPGNGPGKKRLIDFLTRNNVLPKYGFPVDTVELQIGTLGADKVDELQLSRDLQMAIAEYAPGSQIIANGRMYTSRYLRKNTSDTVSWETGYYTECPYCGENNFRTDSDEARCVSCGKVLDQWEMTLEPRLGFIAEDAEGGPVPMHRPERDYKTDDCYVGKKGGTPLSEQEFQVGEGRLLLQATTNDSLAVVGFGTHKVCPVCGYTTDKGKPMPIKHMNPRGYPCRNAGDPWSVRLSHTFKTDVAAVTFLTPYANQKDTMLSVLYALLEGLSSELDIERTDIKGCLHLVRRNVSAEPIYTLILYDAVAGGAGHVRRIVTRDGMVFQRVLKKALEIVDQCKCDTSCYSCIRNYYNQKIHTNLVRKQAADFLRQWQDPLIPVASGEAGKEAAPVSGVVTLTDGEDAQKDFADWAEIENNYGNELSILDGMKISRAGCLTAPTVEVNGEEADAVLAWEDRQILLLNDEPSQGFMDVLKACGWKVFVSDSVPDELVEILKGVD